MQNNPDLKPCPFCGGEAGFGRVTYSDQPGKTFYHVSCMTCHARVADIGGTSFDTKEEAVAHWNRRADYEDKAIMEKILVDHRRELNRLKAHQEGYEKATVDALSAVTVSAIMTAMQRAPK